MNKIFWFCVLAMMVVVGCKEDPCDDYSNYDKIDDRIKPYLFKEGTYWIYQNSVTGEIDSEYVQLVENYLDTNVYMKYTCGTNLGISEVVSMLHKSSLSPGDSFLWLGFGSLVSLYVKKNGVYNEILFLENKVNSIGGCIFYKGGYTNLNVSGIVFSTFDCFQRDILPEACDSFLTYKTDLYFAPSFGLIKKVEYNTPNGTQEWNLIRWNIVQ